MMKIAFVIQSCFTHNLRILLLSLLRQHVRNDIIIIINNNNSNDTIVIVIKSSTIARQSSSFDEQQSSFVASSSSSQKRGEKHFTPGRRKDDDFRRTTTKTSEAPDNSRGWRRREYIFVVPSRWPVRAGEEIGFSHKFRSFEERFEAPLCAWRLRMVHAFRARSIYFFFIFVEKSVWERYSRFSVGFDWV